MILDRHRKWKKKNTFMLLLSISLCVSLAITIFSYHELSQLVHHQLGEKAIAIAQTAALSVNQEPSNLVKSSGSEELHSHLAEIYKLNELEYIYILPRDRERFILYPQQDEVRPIVTNKLNIRSSVMNEAWNGKTVYETNRSNNQFLTVYLQAYAPLYDNNHSQTGILGIGIGEESVKKYMFKVNLGILFMIVTLFGLSFFGSHYLTRQLAKRESALLSHVMCMVDAINAKDNYTKIHSLNVANYAVKLGKFLGMPRDKFLHFYEACVLHDVGKIGVRDDVLKKSDKLTPLEYEEMKNHAEIGTQIVSHIEDLKDYISVIRHHHERPDGQGYPDRLKGDEIPLYARIVAVCDAFDAITTTRPYKRYMSLQESFDELNRVKGTQLNSEAVDAFLKIFNVQPVVLKWLEDHMHLADPSSVKLTHPSYDFDQETFQCTVWFDGRFMQITLLGRQHKGPIQKWHVHTAKAIKINETRQQILSSR